jgi:hypothetical protein
MTVTMALQAFVAARDLEDTARREAEGAKKVLAAAEADLVAAIEEAEPNLPQPTSPDDYFCFSCSGWLVQFDVRPIPPRVRIRPIRVLK